MEVKEESEKVGFKLNIQKAKIMASGSITSWQIDGETMETVANFIFLSSKITADSDRSYEIKRCLLLGRNVMTSLVCCNSWGRKESETTERLHFLSLSLSDTQMTPPLWQKVKKN